LELKPLTPTQVTEAISGLSGLEPAQLDKIALLSRGSIGKAIQLANGDGMALYEAMHRAAKSLPSVDMSSVHALGDLVSRRKADDSDRFPILVNLISEWLASLVLSSARDTAEPEIIEGEHDTRRRLLQMAPLDRWIEVWENVCSLLDSADRVNLDRKQVIIESFSIMAAAASARAS
jgi:DNA polymerase III subunit delta'